MDTRVVHNGISINLEMREAPTELKDGTWAHTARIVSHARLADLDKLRGLLLWGSAVLGVSPKNAKDNQNGEFVSLIMESKKW